MRKVIFTCKKTNDSPLPFPLFLYESQMLLKCEKYEQAEKINKKNDKTVHCAIQTKYAVSATASKYNLHIPCTTKADLVFRWS